MTVPENQNVTSILIAGLNSSLRIPVMQKADSVHNFGSGMFRRSVITAVTKTFYHVLEINGRKEGFLIHILLILLLGFNTVRLIKSRRMRWAGHVARMEEGRGVHRVLVGEA